MSIVSLMSAQNFDSLVKYANVVGTFSIDSESTQLEKYASPPLLNYVEPYPYLGVNKTLFYTEVNTNLKVGDRVFIVNGNYDSFELIKKDKYNKGTDGYRVIYVDRCKIALDINYTGVLPAVERAEGDEMGDYIKVHYVDSYDTFVSANKQLTTRGGYLGGKFDLYQNNIIYVDSDYEPIDDAWVDTLGITASPGFYVREQAYDPKFGRGTTGRYWYNITSQFLSGTTTLASPSLNPTVSLRHFSNNRVLVVGKGFTHAGIEFKANSVYAFDQVQGWIPYIKEQNKFTKAMITKANFRRGDFSGKFNSGIYGSQDEKIDWTNGRWNGGTLFNTRWTGGYMFSNISIDQSHQASLSRDNVATQKANTYNNGGYGWNYVIDSDFEKTTIYGAIVRNTKFGMTPSLPVVENHLKNLPHAFGQTVSNGLFDSCEFNDVHIVGGAIRNSRSRNTLMTGVKHINSFAKDVVLNRSVVISDSVIKIDGYDELTASERRGSIYGATFSDSVDFKVYKFYIGEADWFKLRAKDSFYIKGLTIKNDPGLMNFFDKKFTIGNWNEYVDDFNDTNNTLGNSLPNTFYKRGLRCAAFLTTQDENEWLYSSVRKDNLKSTNGVVSVEEKGYFTDVIARNPNPRYSIDVFVSVFDVNNRRVTGLNFNGTTQSASTIDYVLPPQPKPVIDVSQAYIIDSHIESGVVDNSDWNGGFSIGYNNDLIISGVTNSTRPTIYNITPDLSTGDITVKTLLNSKFPEVVDRDSTSVPLDPQSFDVKVGDVLFLSGVDYYSKGKVLGFTISGTGSGYFTQVDPISLTQSGPSASLRSDVSSGYGLTITYEAGSQTEVSSVKIETEGIDYKVGEVFYILMPLQGSAESNGIGFDAFIEITEVSQSETVRLPDSWKVKSVNYGNQELTLEPISGLSVVKGLTSGGYFTTVDGHNRWNGLSRTRITGSRIKSGIFKRASLTSNLIESELTDVADKDFNDMSAVKDLVVSDTIFSDTSNRLSRATYYNSTLIGGTDLWLDGIAYNSLLNKMTINGGLIKESTWIDGTFNGGLFYWSKSYDARPLTAYPMYYNNRIRSHFVDGDLSTTLANNRWSWRSGTFNGGEFYKSDWEDGDFVDGDFYGSKWYDGVALGGRFGNTLTSLNETRFYNGRVSYTTVNNAVFYSSDASVTGVTSSIVWENGIFNSGVFGSSDQVFGQTSQLTTVKYPKTPVPNSSFFYTYFDPITNKPTELPFVVAIDVDQSVQSVKEILLEVNLEMYAQVWVYAKYPLRYSKLTLTAPDGTSVAGVYDFGDVKSGNKFSATFTTNTSAADVSNAIPPYSGFYRFSFDGLATNMLTAKDLARNGTIGQWKVSIEIPQTYSDWDITAGFSLVIVGEQSSNKYVSNSAVWNAGNFNGGQFVDTAVWKDGNFNGGKFISFYGWTYSGNYDQDGANQGMYSWQGGSFNSGEFGNGSTMSNSTWFNGEFNGGLFKGRVWNGGIFRNGTFLGSGNVASGGWDLKTVATSSYPAQSFVSSYDEYFFGLWRDGIVTSRRDLFLEDKEFSTTQTRANEPTQKSPSAKFLSVLWQNGLFSSEDSTISNSVWLGGTFENGTFENGSFNPYVQEPNGTKRQFRDSSVWNKGVFNGGDFFYSDWYDGRFIIGTAVGMHFREGTSNYMNAYNVIWGTNTTSPTWNNGNWYGSEFEFDGSLTEAKNGFYYGILEKCRARSMGTSVHIWNLFKSNSSDAFNFVNIPADTINTLVVGFHPETTTTIWYPPVIWT